MLRPPSARLLSHGCVAGLVLLVVLGDLLGGRTERIDDLGRAMRRVAQERPAAGRIPAGSFAATLPIGQLRPSVRAALAPALRRPVELIDAFRAPHMLAAGETLGAIAAQYDLPLETLIWANALERGDALALGQWLRIPRVPGVPYTVQDGETLDQIAALHQVPPVAIATFGPNRLAGSGELPVGLELFVPAGVRPLPTELLESAGGMAGLAARGPVSTGLVLGEQTNLRQGPATIYPRMLQLDPGRQVALLARHEAWLNVTIGGVTGWVRGDLLQAEEALVSALPETSAFPPPPPQWVWPAHGTLTSGFGARWGSFHNGIDIANRAWTPIGAASAGLVREAGWCRGYGYCVKLRHAGGIETIYGHLIDQPVVAAGDQVAAGQLIGYMGSTYDRAGGGYSTGVHLHLTIYLNGRVVDPLRFLP